MGVAIVSSERLSDSVALKHKDSLQVPLQEPKAIFLTVIYIGCGHAVTHKSYEYVGVVWVQFHFPIKYLPLYNRKAARITFACPVTKTRSNVAPTSV
jgi:hypothetical protein